MIALVDYGMGNLRSVEKALARAGGDVRVVSDANSVRTAEAMVLPGVGAFGDCLRNLERAGLVEALQGFITSKRPFLGICLGFQALFESSEEAPGVTGLAAFSGNVPRFRFDGTVRLSATLPRGSVGLRSQQAVRAPVSPNVSILKVPHMGWNQLRIKKADCPLLKDVADGSYVYFVHSYYCQPKNASVVCATTEYGIEFCSMLWAGNVFATQFHPEKSQAVGLRMLENFVRLASGPA